MGPYIGEVSLAEALRGKEGLVAGAGLSVCLLPGRRRPYWAAERPWRSFRREAE